mgnify:CR=1 FL=1
MIQYNIFSENIYSKWNIDEKFYIDKAREILIFYLNQPEISERCCLKNHEYNTISFDFLYCDSKKTHEINREYREKDYAADIITFAIFADTAPDKRFIFDGEINLGEVMIALDKVIEESEKKNTSKDYELAFLISHGIMHLLGFDHQTEEDYNFVVKKQKEALKAAGYDEV